jgi:predicted DNA-binding WGR domain protein
MTALCIKLAASSPDHRCHRAYEIAVSADLFGAWLVEMRYGRIGTAGREKVRSFATISEAAAQVTACLRKRASAPRRIGVAYRVHSTDRATAWVQPGLDERMSQWFGGSPSQNGGKAGPAQLPACSQLILHRGLSPF